VFLLPIFAHLGSWVKCTTEIAIPGIGGDARGSDGFQAKLSENPTKHAVYPKMGSLRFLELKFQIQMWS